MPYHIVLTRPLNLPELARDAAAGRQPRHVLWALSQKLGATIWEPGTEPVSRIDRVCARVFSGTPQHWALARRLAATLTSDDLVYCAGEAIGLPLAICAGRSHRPPRIATFVHNIDRPRARLALRTARIRQRVVLCVTNSAYQAAFLRDYAGLPAPRVRSIGDQVDLRFFTPGPPAAAKPRPVVASPGLEQRDQRAFARAVAGVAAEVRITRFSTDARATRSLKMPGNVSARFYEWPDLVQLYRDADVVAVALLESGTCAGLTTFMEALACGRPVVITRTVGLREHVDTPGIAETVPPGDDSALRAAITALLSDPQRAAAMAQRGHAVARERFDSDRWGETLVDLLRGC